MAKLRMQLGAAARMHGAARPGFRPFDVLMLTLTYAKADGWEPGDVKECLRHYRQWHVKRGMKMRYVWVCEVQDGKRRADRRGRGAPHYHVLFWVPQGTHVPMADKAGWWPKGSSKIAAARSATAYILSYLKKGDSKNFDDLPDGCRTYGVGGLDFAMRRARRWLGLPGFVQANSSLRDDWRRAPTGTGGGWIAPDGSRWESEFRMVNCAGARALTRVRTNPRPAGAYGAPSGPFEWIKDRQAAVSR